MDETPPNALDEPTGTPTHPERAGAGEQSKDRPADPSNEDERPIDVVEQASLDSFPASDAPSWAGGTIMRWHRHA